MSTENFAWDENMLKNGSCDWSLFMLNNPYFHKKKKTDMSFPDHRRGHDVCDNLNRCKVLLLAVPFVYLKNLGWTPVDHHYIHYE